MMVNPNNPTIVSTSVDYSARGFDSLSEAERLEELEFLTHVTRDTASCLELAAGTPTHLPADVLTLQENKLERDRKTSPTNIGLYLASLVAMRDLRLTPADQAANSIDEILSTLDRLETHDGLYYNWYDTETGERYALDRDQIVSTVDNAWLAVGLMTVKNAGVGAASEHAGTLLDNIEISKLYDEDAGLFYGHYNASKKSFSNYHNDVLLSETRIASYLGMSREELPPRHLDRLGHHTPSEQAEHGHNTPGGIKSWGGSMFEALMPTLFIDESFSEDLNLVLNQQVHEQIAFGDRNFGGHWGVSVCQTPRKGYQELGIRSNAMSTAYQEMGVITPHAKLLAMPYARETVVAGLRWDLANYPDCYKSQLGYCDSIDIISGDVSDSFLVLDQAMIFLALYNDWQKEAGGLWRYTSHELTSWRSRIGQGAGSIAVSNSEATR